MRVISVTPAGRRRYLAALVPHLLRQRHILDEHHWWLNTNDAADIAYVEQVTAAHPDFFRIARLEVRSDLTMAENIWRYLRGDCRPGHLYIRFDDDIVYMEPDAVERLVAFRLTHRHPLIVYGNIVNNAVCTHFHQRAGIVPLRWGAVHNECMDRYGWWRGPFARKIHELFLDDLRHGRTQRWKDIQLAVDGTRRFSINVICWLGDDLHTLSELASDHIDEEPFLTETLPARMGRPNAACAQALFAHFAFYSQRPFLDQTWPELVEHYQAIALHQSSLADTSETFLKLARDTVYQTHKLAAKVRRHVDKHWLHRTAG